MKIMVMGDVHGWWAALNKIVNRHHPDIILQCGDFGYWPRGEYRFIDEITGRIQYFNPGGQKIGKTKLYFADGNHEDHEMLLKAIEEDQTELYPNIFYMPRGTTLELPTGETVMFFGGADSIDKNFRTPGIDWFPEENITQEQIWNLDPNIKVDIVISHTCPTPFEMGNYRGKENDPNGKALEIVLKMYKPKKWFFGHYHKYKKGSYIHDGGMNKTDWTALHECHLTGGWEWLYK